MAGRPATFWLSSSCSSASSTSRRAAPTTSAAAPQCIRQDEPGDDASARGAGRALRGALLRRRHRLDLRRRAGRRLYAFNPEYGVFGVAKDTNEATNPNAVYAIGEGSRTLFTNVAYNEATKQVWWEGAPRSRPADVTGWRDWRGDLISDRPLERQRSGAAGDEWSHPNSRFTTTLANVPNLSPDADNPKGVPIDAIIFGGRVREREPLIRAVRGVAEGVYDGLHARSPRPPSRPRAKRASCATTHVHAPVPLLSRSPLRRALAQDRRAGATSPCSLMSTGSSATLTAATLARLHGEPARPAMAARFRRRTRGGWRRRLSACSPRQSELNLDGLDIAPTDLERLLSIEVRGRRDGSNREEHLQQFAGLPEEIWEAHRQMKAALG